MRYPFEYLKLRQVILAACLIICLLLLNSCVNKLMYYPPPASYSDTADTLKLKTQDGAWISAVYLPAAPKSYVLLFSHGNAEDIGQNTHFFERCRQNGFGVFAYDYRGYGTSDGTPSEQKTYRDIEAAYDYLVNTLNIEPNKIIIHGRSIGSGPSTYLASRKPAAGLILESPFMSAFRVVDAVSFVPFSPYNNLARIKQVRCPVLIIHGTHDNVIPFRHGQRLYEAASSPKMNFWVQGAGHNNLLYVAGKDYWDTLQAFEQMINSL